MKICPHCRSTNFTHIRYLPMKRKINELLVYCLNQNKGCTAIFTVSQLDSHLNECSYTTVKCSNKCGHSVLRKDLSDHLTNECMNRLSTCIYCFKQDRYFLIVGPHQIDCPDFPVGCPKNCSSGSEVKRKDLNTHKLTCPLQPVQCTDCHTQLLRQQLPDHLVQSCPKRMVLCSYCSLQMTFDVSTKHKQTCPEYPVVCPRHCNLGHELKRKNLEAHTLICPLEPIRCNSCSAELIRKEMDNHCEKKCPKRLTTCRYCKREGPYDHISGNHRGKSEEFPTGCPRKCKGSEQLKRKNLKIHMEVCPLEPVQCPFSDVGRNPLLLRKNLSDHLKSNLEKHMLKLMGAHTQLAAEHDELRSDHNELQSEFSKLKGEHTKLCNDHKTLQSVLTDIQTKHVEMATSFTSMTLSISREMNYFEKQIWNPHLHVLTLH